mgnify:CR=1 FL=1
MYKRQDVNSDATASLIREITGYDVQYTQLPALDGSKTLNNELMDKRSYQVMKLTKDQFSDLVKDDMLVDITDALKVFAPDILANISEESWDVVTINGRIYGIPERASSDNIENMIVFNQDTAVIADTKKKVMELGGLAVTSSYPTNVEINDIHAQKGIALSEYIAERGIKKEEVMVFGDGLNDYSLFTEFPNSFAPENAMEEIRNIASEIIESNENNGVGQTIIRYI